MYIKEEHKISSVNIIIKKYLKEQIINLQIKNLKIEEDFLENKTKIMATLVNNGKIFKITSCSRKGSIHAFFKALYEKYSAEYESIKNITLVEFSVFPDFNKSKKGTDAPATVLLEFENKQRTIIPFKETDKSNIRAAFKALLNGIQFFINLEKASYVLLDCIEHAKERNRTDLLSSYKYDLAFLVEINNFNEEY